MTPLIPTQPLNQPLNFSPGPLTIVVDLDQTCWDSQDVREMYSVRRIYHPRPYLHEFMQEINRHQVMYWTAAGETHAQQGILELGLPHHPLWDTRRCTYGRDHDGEQFSRKHLKKLRVPLSRVIAVDDLSENYERSYANHLKVSPWYWDAPGAQADDELLHAARFIHELSRLSDVRPPEKRGWYTKRTS